MNIITLIRRCVTVGSLILLVILSTGCMGARETDQVAYVLAVGWDKLDDGQIEVTLVIANTLAFASTGGGGGQEAQPYIINSVKAISPWESRNLFSSFGSRQLSFMHTKAYIIGEAAARDGISKYLNGIFRYREDREISSIFICKGKAKEFLMNNKPVLEASPAKQFELLEVTSETTGLFPVTTLHDFYNILKNLHSAPTTGLVGILDANKDKEEQLLEQEEANPLAEPYYAGALPRSHGNKAEFVGTAIFNDDKMVGILNAGESRIMLLLQGKFTSGTFNLSDPKHQENYISLGLRQAKKPEISFKQDDEGLKIQITVFLEGNILVIESGENYEEPKLKRWLEQYFSKEIEKQAQQLIAKTKEQDYGDIFNLDRYYRKEVACWNEWEQLNWRQIYNDAEITVTCKTNIRRPGLMRKTVQTLKEIS